MYCTEVKVHMKENNVSLKGEPEWDPDSEKREHYITFIVNQLTLEENRYDSWSWLL